MLAYLVYSARRTLIIEARITHTKRVEEVKLISASRERTLPVLTYMGAGVRLQELSVPPLLIL